MVPKAAMVSSRTCHDEIIPIRGFWLNTPPLRIARLLAKKTVNWKKYR